MENYKKAFKEINEIFKIMPESLVNKIPNSFKNLIIEGMDNQYNPIIKEPLEDVDLLLDTQIILGLIYRDFLCSTEERKKLQQKDLEKLNETKKDREEKQKKYDVDNIFNKHIDKPKEKNNVLLPIVKEEKWYEKIFNIIKKIFNK